MALIEQDDRARRLARAIVSDFRLRNQGLIDLGADASADIAERREHFRSRTIAALHPVFEEVLRAMELGR